MPYTTAESVANRAEERWLEGRAQQLLRDEIYVALGFAFAFSPASYACELKDKR